MHYLGYRPADRATPFADFYRPEMSALPTHVVHALEHGPQAAPVLPAFEDAAALLDEGRQPTENGFGHLRHGESAVAVLADMPGVAPHMWSWWFGWHGCDSRRYKLWHPRAHVSARWRDGGDHEGYLGRTSLVREYVGSEFTRLAIRFVPPADVGLDASRMNGAVAICARIGSPDLPVDVGWLIHHVRPTAAGSEMRSRFWLGGRHVQWRARPSAADRVLRPFAARQLPDPRDLMVHCAQEMNHLAGFLPALHRRFAVESHS